METTTATPAPYATTFHNDGTVTYWDVHRQSWRTLDADQISDETLATLSDADRERIAGMVTPATRYDLTQDGEALLGAYDTEDGHGMTLDAIEAAVRAVSEPWEKVGVFDYGYADHSYLTQILVQGRHIILSDVKDDGRRYIHIATEAE